MSDKPTDSRPERPAISRGAAMAHGCCTGYRAVPRQPATTSGGRTEQAPARQGETATDRERPGDDDDR